MPDHYDIAIAGAGPSGCVAATLLARRGYSVVLIDPFLPIAGRIESLPENGQTLLADLGLLPALQPAFIAPAQAVELIWRTEEERRDFGATAPILLDRAQLRASLKTHALASGVAIRTGRVTDLGDGCLGIRSDRGQTTVKATVILDARGRAAQPRTRLSEPRIALPFKAKNRTLPPATMLIEALPSEWVWAAANAQGQIQGAVFMPPQDLGWLNDQSRLTLLHDLLATSRLASAEIDSVAPPQPADLSAVDQIQPQPRTICIGDAALARDPISSHGLVYAFRSAAQAVAAASSFLSGEEDAAAARCYLMQRHKMDRDAAIRATAKAYADQNRHPTPFWKSDDVPDAPTPPMIEKGTPLQLDCIAEQLPHLTAQKIVWANGLRVRNTETRFGHCGPFNANALRHALSEPADVDTLAHRLTQFGPAHLAPGVITHLISIGALAPAQPVVQDARRSRS